MSDKSLNTRIPAYKEAFASGEIQKTYQSLVGIVQHLRTDFSKTYISEYSVANLLHGYIDFTYFYLQNDYLKKHKLKLALVFSHHHARFELWLLGQTKDVQTAFWEKLQGTKWVDENKMPEWSIFEVVLLATPDFDDLEKLSTTVHGAFRALSKDIVELLKAYE